MRTIKGPGLFLAQFAGDAAPYDSWDGITKWAASLGYVGVQVPSNDARLFDLDLAVTSQDWRDEFLGIAAQNGVAVTELSSHIQGQLVAVNPVYDEAFDAFAPAHLRGNPRARQEWAVDQVAKTIRASSLLGLNAMATFSGALAWPYLYPWPQRAPGLVETAFDTLAMRWRPLLDLADENGVDVCYEIHPGEDLHDGLTFERFLDAVDASAVYANASTRFTDGGEFGLGAEIGISTQKLHARGPFAAEALTTYKYKLRGTGQVRP